MTDPKPTARLFAALWPPEEVVADLQDCLARAPQDQTGGDIRTTRADTWHITLAFLGTVALDPALRRFTRLSALDLPPAGQIRLAGSGNFGAACWIGVEHGPWLASLAAITRRALHVSDTRFRAHLTVARARGAAPAPAARARAAALQGYGGPPWQPSELLLVQSLLGPQPKYPVQARHQLRPELPDQRVLEQGAGK